MTNIKQSLTTISDPHRLVDLFGYKYIVICTHFGTQMVRDIADVCASKSCKFLRTGTCIICAHIMCMFVC